MSQVLGDHQRKKKRLVPPLLAAMGERYFSYSWAREILPELLWVSILQLGMGEKSGIDFATKMALLADKACKLDPKPVFAKMTSYECLTKEQKDGLRVELSHLPNFGLAMKALQPLHQILQESPFEFLREVTPSSQTDEDRSYVSSLLQKLYDRHSREAVLTMATAIQITGSQGKLIMAGEKASELGEMLQTDFREIENYPNTDASRAAGSSFRAMIPMMTIAPDEKDDKSTEWLDSFWEQIGQIGDCELPYEIEFEDVPKEGLPKVIVTYRNDARRELYDRIKKWRFDLNRIEVHEVVGALLARQATLAVDLASSPNIWTPHSAPLLLRAMADVHITLAWIFGSLEERCRKFVEDGLGAVKLEIAHRKEELNKTDGNNRDLQQMIEYWENWLSSQRIPDLVEVNLSNWSGLTTRKMAEEAGCLDFYNYVYQPFSNAVHSSWPHVSDKNAMFCMNPAHRYHRLATSFDLPIDPFWLTLAAKYLKKTFVLFDDKTGLKFEATSSFERLLQNLDELAGDQAEESAAAMK